MHVICIYTMYHQDWCVWHLMKIILCIKVYLHSFAHDSSWALISTAPQLSSCYSSLEGCVPHFENHWLNESKKLYSNTLHAYVRAYWTGRILACRDNYQLYWKKTKSNIMSLQKVVIFFRNLKSENTASTSLEHALHNLHVSTIMWKCRWSAHITMVLQDFNSDFV